MAAAEPRAPRPYRYPFPARVALRDSKRVFVKPSDGPVKLTMSC